MLAIAVAGFAFRVVTSPAAESPPEMRVDIVTPTSNDPSSFAISPDGRRIVFAASGSIGSQLWLRSLEREVARPLEGTEGATYPFWSPNNKSIAFFADGKLKRVDIGEGSPRNLANAAPGLGGTWNDDDVIVFSATTAGPLTRCLRRVARFASCDSRDRCRPSTNGLSPSGMVALDAARNPVSHAFRSEVEIGEREEYRGRELRCVGRNDLGDRELGGVFGIVRSTRISSGSFVAGTADVVQPRRSNDRHAGRRVRAAQ